MLKTILNRPVAVVTVFTVVVVVSIIMSLGIPLDMYPDTELPIMAVSVTYPGAGPEEMEEEVVRIIEGEIAGLEGIETLESTSYENYAVIVMNMVYGTDVNESLADLRSKLDRIKPLLPPDAEEPVVSQFDPSIMPIMSLSFNGDRSERDLMRIARDELAPALEAMSGVARVSLEGLRESVVRVDIDQEALESYGLSLTQVAKILAVQNIQLGAGSFQESDKDIIIRTTGRYENLREIEETVIFTVPLAQNESGVPVRLGDMGKVAWGYADAESLVRINGEPGIALRIRKSSEANSVEVVDSIKASLAQFNRNLPAGVELSLLTDSTGRIRGNLAQVGSAVGLGILFAVVILMVFLRQGRSTLIAALSIPIALLITLAGLAITGRTLNIVTLVGLSMGVGLIVDSSIVIIENIFRLRQKGAPMGVSAFRGAGEMMAPIVASTLTTIAVFLPLILYKNDLGFIGIFFGELAFVVILALVASLVVAAVLVPVLSSRFLTIHTREERPINNRALAKIDQAMEGGLTALENSFARFLKRTIEHKAWVIAVSVLILGVTLFLARGIDFAMMPQVPQTTVALEVDFPTGTALSETDGMMMELQRRIREELEAVDRILITAEKGGGEIEITFIDGVDTDLEAKRTKEVLRSLFHDYPEMSYGFTSGGAQSRLESSGIDVSVTGTDWDDVTLAADAIAELMNGVEGIAEVDNGVSLGLPQVEIVFDRRAMYEQGLNAGSVATEVRALTGGTVATTYREEGESYDVILRLAEEDRSSVRSLERMFLVNASGERVSLAQIAAIRRSAGPATITREDQIRTIHVVGSLVEGASARSVTRITERILAASAPALPGVEWQVGGEMDDFTETGTTMLLVMVLAALLVVAVMVAQFESFKDPMIIFMAMPMMAVGIVALFLLTETALSMVAFMGIVMLLGIVVNNGIVLVDHTRLMRRRGMGVVEAAVESGRTRLKPVLMTTLTTVLAMTPMAFFPGEGGRIMQPMGLAVVGGLLTAMMGTLVMVPMFYTIAHRRERKDYTSSRERRRMKRLNAGAESEEAA